MQGAVHLNHVGLLGAALQDGKNVTRAKAVPQIEKFEGNMEAHRSDELDELESEDDEEDDE